MIILNSGRKLQIVLSGAITTNTLHITVGYTDKRVADDGLYGGYGSQNSVSNNTTDVDICDAPKSGEIRVIDTIHIYNRDTASATVTVKSDESGTEFILVKTTLATGDTLTYEDG